MPEGDNKGLSLIVMCSHIREISVSFSGQISIVHCQ